MEPNLDRQGQNKLQTQIGQFFDTTREEIHKNSELFLPPVVLSAVAHPSDIKTIGVTTTVTEDVPVYSYHVSWVEKKKKAEVKVKPTKSSENESQKTIPLGRKKSSVMRMCARVRCEGPCGKIVDYGSTVQFGCDHIICDICRKTAQSAACFDGSPGCCNENCVQMAKEAGDKMRAGPNSNSALSAISPRGAFEVIHIHVCILKNCGRDVLRTQLDFEFTSSARLSTLVNTLASYKDLIANSRYYYCTRKPKNRAELEPISLTDTNLRFYDICNNSTELFFIIIGNGIGFL